MNRNLYKFCPPQNKQRGSFLTRPKPVWAGAGRGGGGDCERLRSVGVRMKPGLEFLRKGNIFSTRVRQEITHKLLPDSFLYLVKYESTKSI